MTTLGEKRKAKDIAARLLWTKRADIKWALEQHAAHHGEFGIVKSKTTGIIFAGGHHEDDPTEVWATMARPANHLETEYICIRISTA